MSIINIAAAVAAARKTLELEKKGLWRSKKKKPVIKVKKEVKENEKDIDISHIDIDTITRL